ncbi:zinc finger protein 41 homolog isoform X3 [Corythoichthys intestinalis]|uniref:zinc finger protein 41 homolog isoform X3 n=1 Tax=Corythoichthys intestinalis TaxID=161448 RepID=UPI0025A54379|nr:zinc finger protein 41 homolog isoform X3 [Corythoichthys intestinalis]
MFTRTTLATEKFQEELCGVKEEPPRHQDSTVCKIMHAKVVLRRLEDLCVSQAHCPKHQTSACIKDEEEESPYIKEEEEFVHIQGFSKYLGPEWQESESPGVQEEVEHPQMKQEEPEHPEQQKREVQLPIKKEEVELSYVKEEDDLTMSTGEPLKSEDGPSEASSGMEPPGGSSSLKEGLQTDIFIAPLDRNGGTSHSTYNDDGQKKSHQDDKLCKCSHCGKTFTTKQTCHTHMRTHTGEKPFTCSVCDQGFAEKQSLKRHARTHTGEKPFSCSVCGKKFSEKGNLKKHTTTHTGEKSFSCSVCGQGFAQKQTLKRHARTHTGEKSFSCSVCSQGFTEKQSLKKDTQESTLVKNLFPAQFVVKDSLKFTT